MFKTSGFFGSGQIYLKNSFLFYNFVTHDTPEAVDWVSFVSLKMFCSPIHNLDLRVLASVFLSSLRQFFATFSVAPHWEFWINIGYWMNNTSNPKIRNTQLPVNYILLRHTTLSLQCLESSKMLRIEGCQWRCQGKFKPSIIISLLSLLYLLTVGKGILMSSVAPFKGIRIPESGKSRNAESRIHRV